MSLPKKFKDQLKSRYKHFHLSRIQKQFRPYTMVLAWDYINNLALAERVSAIPGCVVECGVWRGGMSAGLAKILGAERKYFLFDSFEGLPKAENIDGQAAVEWQKNEKGEFYFNNCTAEPDYARQAMTLSGAQSFSLVKGWFKDTLPQFSPPEPIALLRLDGDWYDSTMVCLESLFKHVSPGGLIIIDDYYVWDGCSRATHDFLSRQSATERIQNYRGICYLEKRPANTSKKEVET
jgi:O-methyltransferase